HRIRTVGQGRYRQGNLPGPRAKHLYRVDKGVLGRTVKEADLEGAAGDRYRIAQHTATAVAELRDQVKARTYGDTLERYAEDTVPDPVRSIVVVPKVKVHHVVPVRKGDAIGHLGGRTGIPALP